MPIHESAQCLADIYFVRTRVKYQNRVGLFRSYAGNRMIENFQCGTASPLSKAGIMLNCIQKDPNLVHFSLAANFYNDGWAMRRSFPLSFRYESFHCISAFIFPYFKFDRPVVCMLSPPQGKEAAGIILKKRTGTARKRRSVVCGILSVNVFCPVFYPSA